MPAIQVTTIHPIQIERRVWRSRTEYFFLKPFLGVSIRGLHLGLHGEKLAPLEARQFDVPTGSFRPIASMTVDPDSASQSYHARQIAWKILELYSLGSNGFISPDALTGNCPLLEVCHVAGHHRPNLGLINEFAGRVRLPNFRRVLDEALRFYWTEPRTQPCRSMRQCVRAHTTRLNSPETSTLVIPCEAA